MRYRPRICADILLYRVMRFVRLPGENTARTVRMRNGIWLTYRLNRGDIQGIREMWLNEGYMPPQGARSLEQIVDLGANIGFAALYLSKYLNDAYVVAVEPDPDNVALLRRNLEQNGVRATIIEAAVGLHDGRAAFHRDREANLGRLAVDGEITVRMLSMASIISELPHATVGALLKFDIEGEEERLFSGDLSWLARFDCVVGEGHPDRANIGRITELLAASGLPYHPGGRRGQPSGCFMRPSLVNDPAD